MKGGCWTFVINATYIESALVFQIIDGCCGRAESFGASPFLSTDPDHGDGGLQVTLRITLYFGLE